jgi:hypothetical protein
MAREHACAEELGREADAARAAAGGAALRAEEEAGRAEGALAEAAAGAARAAQLQLRLDAAAGELAAARREAEAAEAGCRQMVEQARGTFWGVGLRIVAWEEWPRGTSSSL